MNKSHFSRKKKIWLAIIAIFTVMVLVWWAWGQFAPRPLGDKLEYLGKRDYGNWLGFDSFPSSTYYYGTDMSPKEVVRYFKKATLDPYDQSEINDTNTDSNVLFSLNAPNTENPIYIDYYSNTEQLKTDGLQTDKKYYLTISDEDYNTAKDSL